MIPIIALLPAFVVGAIAGLAVAWAVIVTPVEMERDELQRQVKDLLLKLYGKKR